MEGQILSGGGLVSDGGVQPWKVGMSFCMIRQHTVSEGNFQAQEPIMQIS